MVGGTPGEGTVSRGSSAQPAGWAAPISADVWHADLTADMPVTILPNGGHLGYVREAWTKWKLLSLFARAADGK